MPDFAVRTSFTATDKLSPAFGKMGKNVNKFGRQGAKGFGMMNASASSLIGTLRMMAPAFGILGALNLANKAIDLASALTEVQNVVDTTFGAKGSKNIEKWADTMIEKVGVSELKAKQFSSTFGAMAKSSGISSDKMLEMSKRVTELSGDMASYRDVAGGAEEVFEKMQSIITGTTKPLRAYGLNLTVANLSTFALTQGITKSWKQMSQAEQIMLRYNFVMKNTVDAQGDFSKTLATSYANQKRVLGLRFDQFLAKIAVKFLPTLITGFEALNSILKNIDTEKVSKGLSTIIDLVKYATIIFLSYKAALILTSAWQGAIIAIGWIKYLWMMRTAIIAAAQAQGILNLIMSLNPISLVVLAIAALIAGFVFLAIKVGGIKNAFIVLGKSIMKFVLAPVNLLLYYIRGILKLATYLPGVGGAASSALEKLTAVQNSMNKKFEITEFDKKEAPNKDQLAAGQGQTNININNKGVETETTSTPKRNVKIKGNMGKNK